MKVSQLLFKDGAIAKRRGDAIDNNAPLLVLGFGAKYILAEIDFYDNLRKQFPNANIILCSTSGEIYDDSVSDNTVSVLLIELERTTIEAVSTGIEETGSSFSAGKYLFNKLENNTLKHVLLFSDGSTVNGSELVRGINSINKNNVTVTGGLAGDAANFDYTLVGHNQAPKEGVIVAIGFYGDNIRIGHGSIGGWDIFGPEKRVTRSISNRLFEIDGKSALDMYKQYLGKYADELPGSALLFPLHVRTDGSENTVVRTILSIDNTEKSMVFAGDIPEGSYVRFMKANFDKLIDAATVAAGNTLDSLDENFRPKLALLISCVGRKLILGKRIDEEIEAVKDVFGDSTIISGFYSYGEISPLSQSTTCELHNQTMTITTFDEYVN